MATISSAGVGSGLDIEGIISGLMAVERKPITQIQTQQSGLRSDISAYGRVQVRCRPCKARPNRSRPVPRSPPPRQSRPMRRY